MSTAAEVLDTHARLHDLLAHPGKGLRDFAAYEARTLVDAGAHTYEDMFYPFYDPHQPASRQVPGWEGMFWGALAKGLFTARTYQVTSAMCEVADKIYQNSREKIDHIEESDLPSESGFLWLDTAFYPDYGDDDARPDPREVPAVRVMTWTPQVVRYKDEAVPGVRMAAWTETETALASRPRLNEFAAMDDTDRRVVRTAMGPLIMIFSAVMPYGQRFSFSVPGLGAGFGHYIHALWLLLGTEVAVTSRAPLDRHARRRALRSVRHGEVNVVTLRRALSARPEGEYGHRDVDWSCRWVVQGFWRHIEDYSELAKRHRAVPGDPVRGRNGWYYCEGCAAIVTWVSPCVRGPKDKPLKATQQLYRLSR